MRNDFAVFILSHGRANKIKTMRALDEGNYTGKRYIIIDNEDEQEEAYRNQFGDRVVVFDKKKQAELTDTADNFKGRGVVVFARNACWSIAKELGLTHFLVLDDDYTVFHFRKVVEDKFIAINCKQLDDLFSAFCDFLDESNALTVTMAQGGDFIGGKDNLNFRKGILRKAMNTFFCRTDRPFDFLGRINEDVNAYVKYGSMGELMFTITKVSIVQTTTQTNAGGLTEAYLDSGTYVKSFYSVMVNPSCVTIREMGESHKRMHHRIQWEHCVPKILQERWKK